jgi:CPA2 family monovalent cation:H+ antiporter-2
MRVEGRKLLVVEEEPDIARDAAAAGHRIVRGNATDPSVLQAAGIADAAKLLIAIPEGFEGGAVAERARRLNAALTIVARAHSDAEVAHLERLGADRVVMGERETADRMFQLASAPSPAPAAGSA